MSDERRKNKKEELTAFEAALRSLRPRADRLDPSWRAELAKQAALGPRSFGERAGSKAPGVGSTSCCTNPSGHRYVCVYCGHDAAFARSGGRWLWPATLLATTAVAAVLLTMLIARWQPQVADPAGREGAAIPATAVARQPSSPFAVQHEQGSEYPPPTDPPLRPTYNTGGEEMSYLTLRDQVLQERVEAWRFPAPSVVLTAKTTDAAETPRSHREQLSRLLEQQGLRGS
jgi:hypothetical protein